MPKRRSTRRIAGSVCPRLVFSALRLKDFESALMQRFLVPELAPRRDGNARADPSRSRGNGGTRRHGSDDDKGSAGNDRAGASRAVWRIWRRGEHSFLLI